MFEVLMCEMYQWNCLFLVIRFPNAADNKKEKYLILPGIFLETNFQIQSRSERYRLLVYLYGAGLACRNPLKVLVE